MDATDAPGLLTLLLALSVLFAGQFVIEHKAIDGVHLPLGVIALVAQVKFLAAYGAC
jgi:hypothetical protein